MADTNQLEPFKPEEMEEVAAYRLSHSEEPDWRNDPTYNLLRKK